jgi:hypothetical protein
MRRFSHFACIDWSGAVTPRPPGIAVAQIGLDGPPDLITPTPRWSREDVRDWLLGHADEESDILIGMDLSFGFPFIDKASYFPEWADSPADARGLWAMVDALCGDDPHLGASTFLTHPEGRRHFRHAKGDVGDLFEGGIGRLRVVEDHQRTTKQANSWSCFNLVGAGQVGKSSLTGMRLLHRLAGRIPIWPFDPVPETGPMLIEIYTSMAARAAGIPPGRSKIRDRDTLNAALTKLDSPTSMRLARYDDHSTDALITAAWLRKKARDPALWHPEKLNLHIAATEGWTFGVI